MIGHVNSIQTLGTVDGPGVRFVVFLQGCNLRCKCCHNPDTWEMNIGKEYTPVQIFEMAKRYREYFGENGGITLSGGEPILQSVFAKELFALCRENGINTCLDTSGCFINEEVEALIDETDRVLLDIKYTDDGLYKRNVGCSLRFVLEFLDLLETKQIKTTLRQVIIPTVNDTEENIRALAKIRDKYSCVDSVELLPFRKICQVKYDNMGIDFPFGSFNEPTEADIEKLKKFL